MGGSGSGRGSKAGVGRKRKSDRAKWLGGRSRKRPGTSKPAPTDFELRLLAAPDDLRPPEREIWAALAPRARDAGTLTLTTSHAFQLLVETIAWRRAMMQQIERDGITCTDGRGEEKRHPLLTEIRLLGARIEQMSIRFKLSPVGQALDDATPPLSDMDAREARAFDDFDEVQ